MLLFLKPRRHLCLGTAYGVWWSSGDVCSHAAFKDTFWAPFFDPTLTCSAARITLLSFIGSRTCLHYLFQLLTAQLKSYVSWKLQHLVLKKKIFVYTLALKISDFLFVPWPNWRPWLERRPFGCCGGLFFPHYFLIFLALCSGAIAKTRLNVFLPFKYVKQMQSTTTILQQ